ncbi:heavy-metal-associated domain-containing protein [Rheinheimera gaetbuli]
MQTDLIKVTGMSCGGCATKVTQALQAVSGVSDVTVTFSAGVAEVRYDEMQTSAEKLKAAVKGAGYGVDKANTADIEQPKGGSCG